MADAGPPILYSFRRCPYAIRARLALARSGWRPGRDLEVREVHLAARPPELLAANPAATVPVLVRPDRGPHRTLVDSLAIMEAAGGAMASGLARAAARALIAENDGPFKHHLDRWKYPERHAGAAMGGLAAADHRQAALAILRRWNGLLEGGESPLAEAGDAGMDPAAMALLPFVRQFAQVDPAGWSAEPGIGALRAWLARGLADPLLAAVLAPPWAQRRPWLSPRWIYHLALAPEWQQARQQGLYERSTRGLSLAEVGFVHASYAHQVAATFERFYADAGPVRLLCIDPAALGTALRPEPAPDSGELFPHLHGPLPLQAVVAVLPWRHGDG
ncbi:MAG: DUF952 domain-containing protein [Synechococcaceae cyanobacterium]|jgi:glutathione S-transferase